jgi:hypothetical protein
VYQHSVISNKWNQDDEINYSRALPRRLPAEVLYDAIQRATGSTSHLPGLPAGARAALLLDSNVEVPGGFLDLFGKPARESACECERSSSMMLGPVLNLVNGPVVGEAIRDPGNRIARILTTEKNDAKVVEELYLSVLCRLPTAKEMKAGLACLKDGQGDYAKMVEEAARRAAAVKAREQQLDSIQASWEAGLKNTPVWMPLDSLTAVAKGGAKLTKQPDGSLLVSGNNPTMDTFTVTANTVLKGITAIRLEVLPDPSLPAQGPGRAPNGNFVLSHFTLTAKEAGTKGPVKPVALTHGQATFAQDGFPANDALTNQPNKGWAVMPQFGKAHSAFFELTAPLATAKDAELTFTLVHRSPHSQHTIGKFRLYATTTKPPLVLTPLPEPLARLIAVEPVKRTPQQKAELTQYFRGQDAELRQVQQAVAEFGQPVDIRQPGAQDLVWALLNSKAFLFNR